MLDDMIIFKKLYDLQLWLYPTIKQFPKSDKFVIGERVEECCLNALTIFIEVNNAEIKKPHLKSLNTELEKLRILIRLTKDLKLLPFNKYEIAQRQISEIFKLLGGMTRKFA